MRPIPILMLAVAAAFAGCASDSSARYAPGDPLAGALAAKTYYRVIAATEPSKIPLFKAALPAPWRRSEGRFSEPVLAMFTKSLPAGESTIIVERYGAAESKDTFRRNLVDGGKIPPATTHKLGGVSYSVYHGLEFARFSRRVPPGDPYLSYLGARYKPPRLSILEKRRFLKGGDAYRLYRCRKLRAWGILGDYRRLRAAKRLREFRAAAFNPAARRILSACFGRSVLMAVDTGKAVAKISKPGMYRLRIMAREEWTYGASRIIERECVHLREAPGGFLVLRYRAPKDVFRHDHAAFESFLTTFLLY